MDRSEGMLAGGGGKSKGQSATARPEQFADYLAHLERRGLSPATLALYGECLRTFGRFLSEVGKPATAMTFPELMTFHVWLNKEHKRNGGSFSAAYRSTHVTAVKGLYRWLYAEGAIATDPGRRLRLPRLGRQISRNVLSFQETRRLLATPGHTTQGMRDRIVLRLLALSGPRVSELAGLDVGDVVMSGRELTIRKGKGAKDRLIFFDRWTARYLARYLAHCRPKLVEPGEKALLVDDSRLRLRPHQLRRIVRQHARRAGIARPITCHSLRHTFCTNLLRAGANLKSIAELAGHASMDTTAKYTRVDISDLASVYRSAHPLAGRRA
ncbi:MAG TPA: tyrosine-type recombinase/integrase [Phycisphaerae bacterium]|nr:tyrosine-type recombinase/integrase [Phycisphaerae bacterium]